MLRSDKSASKFDDILATKPNNTYVDLKKNCVIKYATITNDNINNLKDITNTNNIRNIEHYNKLEIHTKDNISLKSNSFIQERTTLTATEDGSPSLSQFHSNNECSNKKILHIKKSTANSTLRRRSIENSLDKYIENQKKLKSNQIVKITEQQGEEFNKTICDGSSQNKMHLAINLLLRIVIPLANGVASRLKGFRSDRLWQALRSIGASKQSIANLFASAANTISMGLSSVQVSHRIDPILKIMKIRKASTINLHSTPMIMPSVYQNNAYLNPIIQCNQLSIPKIYLESELYETAEQCITVNILAEPSSGTPIRADIIFIHGLHGSLKNTWKQGLWSNERNPVEFDRPPKPPLRPPKRPRHSRSNIFIPPHTNKKFRFGEDIFQSFDNNDLDFILDYEYDKDENNFLDPNLSTESEHSFNFSTFRLRLDDYETSSRPTSPTQNFNSQSSLSKNNAKSKETEPYSSCWPGDWLPLDCPGVRVIAVNYTTDPHLWRPVWFKKHYRSSMNERVRVMTERLVKLKVGYGHPIIWVGHSKGGLFIKQILVDAWDSGKPAVAPLLRSSRGVFFYSVPHRGSSLADINLPFVRRSIELIEIEKNSKVLLDLHRRFVSLYYSGHLKIEVFSFVETALTFMQFLYLKIVGVDSADPSIGNVCGLRLDHREICKPRNRKCILYTELVEMIKKVS